MLYILTEYYSADLESRILKFRETYIKLMPVYWQLVQKRFGPHTVDLMALDANAMLGDDGNVADELNPYVFPPFCLIAHVLSFLVQRSPFSSFRYPMESREFESQPRPVLLVLARKMKLQSFFNLVVVISNFQMMMSLQIC